MTINADGRISEQVVHAFPAYKVFIYGVDVTDDVFGVTINQSVGRQINTATITLSNELNKYLFTDTDLNNIFNAQQVRAAAIANAKAVQEYISGSGSVPLTYKEQVTLDQLLLQQVTTIQPQIKQDILKQKITVRTPNVVQPDITNASGAIPWLIGNAYRYPLHSFDCIFHPNDPVRIFFRDPFNPNIWYHKFTGFCSSFDDFESENNERIITITAESQSKLLNYARIQTNPIALDGNTQTIPQQDADLRSFYTAGFADMTLPEIMFFIIFGNNPNNSTNGAKFNLTLTNTKNSKAAQTPISGIGNFNFSQSGVIEFGPNTNDPLNIQGIYSASTSDLSTYQSILDHQVTIQDMTNMLIENIDIATYNQVQSDIQLAPQINGFPDPLYIINYIGTHSTWYPPDSGRLILLMPASLQAGMNREILLRDLIQNPSINAEYKSRISIIWDMIERIEFQYYDSPKGDIIVEFPMYDFDPDDFDAPGTSSLTPAPAPPSGVPNQNQTLPSIKSTPIPVPYTIFTNGVISQITELDFQGMPSYTIDDNGNFVFSQNTINIGGNFNTSSRGPFGPRYQINRNNTYSVSKETSDAKVRTQLATSFSVLQNNTAGGNAKELGRVITVTLKALTPLYGIRAETVDPKGFIANEQSARLYAQVLLNRLNADAKNFGLNIIPNFGLWLNRPVLITQRDSIGLVMSITDTINWGMNGSCETKIGVAYVRGWDGLIDQFNLKVYTPIGGLASNPLNYKQLFSKNPVQSSNNTSNANAAPNSPAKAPDQA